MSGYKGPRGPNVSQYVANLNQLSPPTDNLAEPQPVTEDFSAFLNTDFFDINGGTNVDLNSPIDFDVDFDIKQSTQPTAENTPRNSISTGSAKPNMDFNLNGKSVWRACRSISLLLSTLFVNASTMAGGSSQCAGQSHVQTGHTPRCHVHLCPHTALPQPFTA
jgi:hypothetical protein